MNLTSICIIFSVSDRCTFFVTILQNSPICLVAFKYERARVCTRTCVLACVCFEMFCVCEAVHVSVCDVRRVNLSTLMEPADSGITNVRLG